MNEVERIIAVVDRLVDVAQDAWARTGDLLEAASEDLDLPMSDLIDQVATELHARFDDQ